MVYDLALSNITLGSLMAVVVVVVMEKMDTMIDLTVRLRVWVVWAQVVARVAAITSFSATVTRSRWS